MQNIKAKSIYRAIAFMTLCCFVVTQSVIAAPSAGIEMMRGGETPGFLQVDIPADLATLDDIYEASVSTDPKLIIQIRNAHANYSAQQKIRQLLEYLHKNYAINTIFVEGASERLDPNYLKFFPDQENNLKLADLLVKKGELTGVEQYILEVDGQGVEAEGIEDADLYRSNYEALKKVFSSETVVSKYIGGLEARLETLSSKISSPEMRRMLSEWKKFEKGRREFMPYIRSLADAAEQVLELDLENLFAQVTWPQITRLLVLQELEKEMNIERADAEKADLVKFLQKKNISKDLIQAIEDFKDQHISVTRKGEGGAAEALRPRHLLERLAQEAGPKGFQFSDYPHFSARAGFLILKSELDSMALFDEINRLFTRILDKLAKTENQTALLSLYRDEEIVRKLLNLELTRSDWAEAETKRPELAMDSMVERLRELGKAINTELNLEDTAFETKKVSEEFRSGVNGIYDAAYSFYGYARKREEVFYEKMLQVMTGKGENKAVMITGGFHTEGVSELLRENEVNYAILTPRLTEKSNEKLYQEAMLQTTPTIFDAATLELASKMMSAVALAEQGLNPGQNVKELLDGAFNIMRGSRNLEAELSYLQNFLPQYYPGYSIQFETTDRGFSVQFLRNDKLISRDGKALTLEIEAITDRYSIVPTLTQPFTTVAEPAVTPTVEVPAAPETRSEAREFIERDHQDWLRGVRSARQMSGIVAVAVTLAVAGLFGTGCEEISRRAADGIGIEQADAQVGWQPLLPEDIPQRYTSFTNMSAQEQALIEDAWNEALDLALDGRDPNVLVLLSDPQWQGFVFKMPDAEGRPEGGIGGRGYERLIAFDQSTFRSLMDARDAYWSQFVQTVVHELLHTIHQQTGTFDARTELEEENVTRVETALFFEQSFFIYDGGTDAVSMYAPPNYEDLPTDLGGNKVVFSISTSDGMMSMNAYPGQIPDSAVTQAQEMASQARSEVRVGDADRSVRKITDRARTAFQMLTAAALAVVPAPLLAPALVDPVTEEAIVSREDTAGPREEVQDVVERTGRYARRIMSLIANKPDARAPTAPDYDPTESIWSLSMKYGEKVQDLERLPLLARTQKAAVRGEIDALHAQIVATGRLVEEILSLWEGEHYGQVEQVLRENLRKLSLEERLSTVLPIVDFDVSLVAAREAYEQWAQTYFTSRDLEKKAQAGVGILSSDHQIDSYLLRIIEDGAVTDQGRLSPGPEGSQAAFQELKQQYNENMKVLQDHRAALRITQQAKPTNAAQRETWEQRRKIALAELERLSPLREEALATLRRILPFMEAMKDYANIGVQPSFDIDVGKGAFGAVIIKSYIDHIHEELTAARSEARFVEEVETFELPTQAMGRLSGLQEPTPITVSVDGKEVSRITARLAFEGNEPWTNFYYTPADGEPVFIAALPGQMSNHRGDRSVTAKAQGEERIRFFLRTLQGSYAEVLFNRNGTPVAAGNSNQRVLGYGVAARSSFGSWLRDQVGRLVPNFAHAQHVAGETLSAAETFLASLSDMTTQEILPTSLDLATARSEMRGEVFQLPAQEIGRESPLQEPMTISVTRAGRNGVSIPVSAITTKLTREGNEYWTNFYYAPEVGDPVFLTALPGNISRRGQPIVAKVETNADDVEYLTFFLRTLSGAYAEVIFNADGTPIQPRVSAEKSPAERIRSYGVVGDQEGVAKWFRNAMGTVIPNTDHPKHVPGQPLGEAMTLMTMLGLSTAGWNLARARSEVRDTEDSDSDETETLDALADWEAMEDDFYDSDESPVTMAYGFDKDIGGRGEQQDFNVNEKVNFTDVPIHGEGRIMAVADGHGGYRVSQYLIDRVEGYFHQALRDARGDVERAMRALHERFLSETAEARPGSTFTFVYAPSDERAAYVMVYGDSPAFIIGDRGAALNFRSQDHNIRDPKEQAAFLSWAARQGLKQGEDFHIMNGYLFASNSAGLQLTRSYGDSDMRRLLNPAADIQRVDLSRMGEVEIAVGSDGLSVLSDAQIRQLIMSEDPVNGLISAAKEGWREKAKQRGMGADELDRLMDNISVAFVRRAQPVNEDEPVTEDAITADTADTELPTAEALPSAGEAVLDEEEDWLDDEDDAELTQADALPGDPVTTAFILARGTARNPVQFDPNNFTFTLDPSYRNTAQPAFEKEMIITTQGAKSTQIQRVVWALNQVAQRRFTDAQRQQFAEALTEKWPSLWLLSEGMLTDLVLQLDTGEPDYRGYVQTYLENVMAYLAAELPVEQDRIFSELADSYDFFKGLQQAGRSEVRVVAEIAMQLNADLNALRANLNADVPIVNATSREVIEIISPRGLGTVVVTNPEKIVVTEQNQLSITHMNSKTGESQTDILPLILPTKITEPITLDQYLAEQSARSEVREATAADFARNYPDPEGRGFVRIADALLGTPGLNFDEALRYIRDGTVIPVSADTVRVVGTTTSVLQEVVGRGREIRAEDFARNSPNPEDRGFVRITDALPGTPGLNFDEALRYIRDGTLMPDSADTVRVVGTTTSVFQEVVGRGREIRAEDFSRNYPDGQGMVNIEGALPGSPTLNLDEALRGIQDGALMPVSPNTVRAAAMDAQVYQSGIVRMREFRAEDFARNYPDDQGGVNIEGAVPGSLTLNLDEALRGIQNGALMPVSPNTVRVALMSVQTYQSGIEKMRELRARSEVREFELPREAKRGTSLASPKQVRVLRSDDPAGKRSFGILANTVVVGDEVWTNFTTEDGYFLTALPGQISSARATAGVEQGSDGKEYMSVFLRTMQGAYAEVMFAENGKPIELGTPAVNRIRSYGVASNWVQKNGRAVPDVSHPRHISGPILSAAAALLMALGVYQAPLATPADGTGVAAVDVTAARSEVRSLISAENMTLVDQAQLGPDADVIQALERMNIDAELFPVVVVAAVAGKIMGAEVTPEVMAQAIEILALSTAKPVAAAMVEVKALLSIQDAPGFVAEFVEAGTGMTEDDRIGYRAIMLNSLQQVDLVWVSDAANIAAMRTIAQQLVAEEMAWAKGKGLDFDGRFNIRVIDRARADREVRSIQAQAQRNLSAIAAQPSQFFVMSITPDMLQSLALDVDLLRAAVIEKGDYRDVAVRFGARFVTAQASQDLVTTGDVLSQRTSTMLERRGNLYIFNETSLQAFARQIWTDVMAEYRVAVSA